MKRSSVYKLDPLIDEGGLLRVGGRLRKCITRLIVEWCHQKMAHGRGLPSQKISEILLLHSGIIVVLSNK